MVKNCRAEVVCVIEMAAAKARAVEVHATPREVCLRNSFQLSGPEFWLALICRFRKMRNKSPIMKVHPAAAMSQRRILFWRTRHRLKRLLAEALASGPESVDVLPLDSGKAI